MWLSSVSILPHLFRLKSGHAAVRSGLARVPMATTAISASNSNSLPSIGTGRRKRTIYDGELPTSLPGSLRAQLGTAEDSIPLGDPRIDGRLQVVLTPPTRLHSSIIARIKVMSGMDIAKRRIPQDGHIAIVYENETVHYRVSTLPTVFGEKCVVRLLKKDKSLMGLDTIGFEPEELAQVKRASTQPQGLILVTGPTGSGKTTTLHAALNFVCQPEINIVTLEDPVEATLPDINHVKIDEQGGVTFSSGLRSILRQDPDVVFVGEM